MAFWLNIASLVRRRRPALIAVGVALLMSVAALLGLPDRYTSTSVLVLTTSPTNAAAVAGDSSVPVQINPLLNFSDGLNTAVQIVVTALNTDEVIGGLETDSGAEITITNIGGADFLGNNQGPFLFLTGTSYGSPQAALDVVTKASDRAHQELEDRQRALDAPRDQFISILPIVKPTVPIASAMLRVGGAIGGFLLGFILVIGWAYVREVRRGGFATAIGDGEGPAARYSAETVRIGALPRLQWDPTPPDRPQEPLVHPLAQVGSAPHLNGDRRGARGSNGRTVHLLTGPALARRRSRSAPAESPVDATPIAVPVGSPEDPVEEPAAGPTDAEPDLQPGPAEPAVTDEQVTDAPEPSEQFEPTEPVPSANRPRSWLTWRRGRSTKAGFGDDPAAEVATEAVTEETTKGTTRDMTDEPAQESVCVPDSTAQATGIS